MGQEIEDLVEIVEHTWGGCGVSDSAEQILNVRDIYERMGDSVYRVRLVLTSFLECLKGEVQQLEVAAERGASRDVQEAAHALRGLLLEVSAQGPAAVAARLESLSFDSDVGEHAQLVAQLTTQTTVLARLIRDVLMQTTAYDKVGRAKGGTSR
jgi:hypothetical protein